MPDCSGGGGPAPDGHSVWLRATGERRVIQEGAVLAVLGEGGGGGLQGGEGADNPDGRQFLAWKQYYPGGPKYYSKQQWENVFPIPHKK